MRVLMLAQFYPPLIGGEERHVRNLALALADRGHGVAVATTWQKGLEPFEMDGPVAVHRLRGMTQRAGVLFSESGRRYVPPFPDPELLVRLRQTLASVKADIVHAHNWMLHSYLPLKRPSGPGLVVTLHDLSLVCVQKNMMRGDEPCAGPAIGKCLRCAGAHYGPLKGGITTIGNWLSSAIERQTVDQFIVVSGAVAAGNQLEKGKTPFEIVPNFVSDGVESPPVAANVQADSLPKGEFLLYVGDLRRLKGVHVLIDAYARLTNAPPLVLIGRRCTDTPAGLPPNVFMFESWPHAAVMQAWRRCMFGISPSILPESCASVIIEAMLAGKPMIATTVGGTPDLVDQGKTGLLVPPCDADALSGAMRRLLEDADLRARMASAGRRKARNFAASAVVPRIEAIYAKVLAARGSARTMRERGLDEAARPG